MLTSSISNPDPSPTGQEALDIGSMVKKAFNVLRRRFIVWLVVTLGVFAVIVMLSMLITPKYEAVSRVKIDPKPMAASGVGSDQSVNMPDQSVVDTEVSVMRSRDIAAVVVRQLNLDSDPEFVDLEKSSIPSDRLDAATTAVLKATTVDREKTTYLVDIRATSINAAKAANIANAFAAAYIKATVSRRTGTAEEQRGWLDKRMAELSVQSHAADAALAQYKASAGLTEGGGTLGTITDQQIAPISNQLATAQAENASAQSDLHVAQAQMESGGSTSASGVLDSPALEGLRSSRATTVQTISQLASRYGPKHPQTIQAQQQLAAIDTQIQQEAQRIVSQLDSRARAASAQAGSLSGDLSRLRSEQGANARSQVTADSLQRDADAKHNAYNNLAQVAQQIDQLSQNSMSQAQIIEQAVPASKPNSPRTILLLGGGLLVAMTIGTGVIGVQEMMSSGLLTATDVERVLGFGVLSSVPMLRSKDYAGTSGNPADAVIARPMSPYAEAFRVVRSSLALASEAQPRVIGIASSLPAEGKTTSAISLARIMAMSGERTLLIDGDIRRARLQTIIKERPPIGLVEVLRDGADPTGAIVADEVRGLDILSPSEASFLKEDLFSGDAMPNLLEKMRAKYDRIIVDTPPLLGVADARILATLCDTVILAVKWNDTPRSACKLAASWLRQDHANVAGVMLTMVSPASEAFGALYYSKKYSEYYQTA